MPDKLDETLLERIWPDGLSPADEALWAASTAERRAITLRRIAALSDYEDGRIGATPAAVQAGTSAATFFRMAARWREGRSLSGVVPHGRLGRAPRAGLGAPEPVRKAVRDAVATAPPGRSQEAIARAVHESFPSGPGIHMIRKTVGAELAARRLTSAAFGRRLLVDSVVVDLEHGRARMRTTVDVAVDQELGLVLGLTRPHEPGEFAGRWGVLLDAVRRWAEEAPASWKSAPGRPHLEVVLPEANGVQMIAHMKAVPECDALSIIEEARSIGLRAHAAVAGRIGRLGLRPRLEATPGFAVLQEPSEEDAPTGRIFDLLAAQEVAAHNARILANAVAAFASTESVVEAFARVLQPR